MRIIMRFVENCPGLIFLSKKFRAGEPEPVGAGCFWLIGAGAAKKLAGSSALREDKS